MLHDFRLAARSLAQSPGFLAIALIMLTLSIGANTAIFSVIDALLLRPLPVKDPARLVAVYERRPKQAGRERNSVSGPDLVDWQARNKSFESIAGSIGWSFNITGRADPLNVNGARATGNFFETLGIAPLLGRLFTAADARPGAEPVCVLSHALWVGAFGARSDAIGKEIVVNEKPATIIGVLPANFQFPTREFQMWMPVEPLSVNNNRSNHNWYLVARLKPGVSIEAARSDMDNVTKALESEYPRTNTAHYANVFPLHSELVREFDTALIVVAGAVGLVLLIACANLANLLLTRAMARERQLAVQLALGAPIWRLVRQILAENILIVSASCAGAVLVALWLVDFLAARLAPLASGIAAIEVDFRVLLFAAGASFLAAVVSTIPPALFAARRRSLLAIPSASRSATESAPRLRMKSSLIVVEVAFTCMLCVGAGLFFRSFIRLASVDPGFDENRVLVVRVQKRMAKYEPAPVAAFYREFVDRAARLPGVQAAGAVSQLPLSGQQSTSNFGIQNAAAATYQEQYNAATRIATLDYFRTIALPLKKGRLFAESDHFDAPNVVLVNEALVRKYWPNTDPIGQRIRVSSPDWREVVGVVGDVKHDGLNLDPYPEIYFPHTQEPSSQMNVLLRTAGSPLSVVPALKNELAAIDKDQPIAKIATLQSVMDESVARPRLYTELLGAFAILAMVLSGAGIYGVISYSIAQRTQEFGIRAALGARPRDILSLATRSGAIVVLIGLAIGAAGSFALRHVVSKLLFEVQPEDPLTYAAAFLLLAAVAAAATAIPAWRATRVDPLVALRYE